MSEHPACCKSPETCTLSYRDHLVGFHASAMAIPNRLINHTEGEVFPVPDEPVAQTLIREKRWERDMAAYKRLHEDGVTPPQIDGSALREKRGETVYDVVERPVTIDYSDPR